MSTELAPGQCDLAKSRSVTAGSNIANNLVAGSVEECCFLCANITTCLNWSWRISTRVCELWQSVVATANDVDSYCGYRNLPGKKYIYVLFPPCIDFLCVI